MLTSESLLVPASDANKEMLLELFARVEPGGSTNFEEVRGLPSWYFINVWEGEAPRRL